MPPPPFGWLAHRAILEFTAGRLKTRSCYHVLSPSNNTSWKLEGFLLSDDTLYNIIDHRLYSILPTNKIIGL